MFDNLKREYGTLAFLYNLNTQSANISTGVQSSTYTITQIRDCIIFPNTKADDVLLKGINIDTQYGGVLAVNTSMALLPPDLTVRTIDYILTESTKYQIVRSTKCSKYIYCVLKSVDDLILFDSDVELYTTTFRNKVYLDSLTKEIKSKVTTYTLYPALLGQPAILTGTFKEVGLNGYLTASTQSLVYADSPTTYSVNFAFKTYFEIEFNTTAIKFEDSVLTIGSLYMATLTTDFNTLAIECDETDLVFKVNDTIVLTEEAETLDYVNISLGSKICTYLYTDYASHSLTTFNRLLGRTDT